MSDAKKPLDQAVELVVFAPIGLALEAKRLLPSFVEQGRSKVQIYKMVGQLAVAHGKNEGTKRLSKVQDQAGSILSEFGIGAAPASSTAASATEEAAERRDAPATAPTPIRSSSASATLSIADYDSLAASQVIPRLGGLTPAELEAVRSYELAHRGRKTILGKIAQLTGE